MEIPKRPIQNGDCVFFKSIRIGTKKNAATVHFKGHGFGILMGHVPPFGAEPDSLHLLRVLGTCGFISFDDIGEFVSAEVAQGILSKFEAKYYGPQPEPVLAGDNLDPDASPSQPAKVGDASGSTCEHGVVLSHVCIDCEDKETPPTKIVGLDGNPLQ